MKFEIGDKVKIVEKEYPTTGIKYFDFLIANSYLTTYKHHFGKTGEVKRYDEYDDVYSIWLDSDRSQVSVPAYFLELVPTVKYAVLFSFYNIHSLPGCIAEFDTEEEAVNYMREIIAKQASAAIKKGKEYKYKMTDTIVALEDYCMFVQKIGG